jgi:hypothetical protein
MQLITSLVLVLAISSVLASPADRVKRQLFPDYYSALLDYAAYDYYDWVCTGNNCVLCDILTGECCNPAAPNCFMPDSCANNPCLTGGTCITTTTIDGRPDFTCVCKSGLTGKYCQLRDDFAPPILPIGK